MLPSQMNKKISAGRLLKADGSSGGGVAAMAVNGCVVRYTARTEQVMSKGLGGKDSGYI
jgi:hypothetical protein